MTMRNGMILAGIAFAVGLAIVVGNRLSAEAMAVVVGAVCGISASVPLCLGLVIATSNNWGKSESPREVGYDYPTHRYAPQPPIYVVSAPPAQMPFGFMPNQYVIPPNAPTIGAPREFKIIGEE